MLEPNKTFGKLCMVETSVAMPSKARARDVIEHLLKPEDYKIAYLILSMGKEPRLQVAIETTEGTPPTINVCTRFHRQIRLHLLTEGLFGEHFNLEVSSPGLDRPLFEKADFERFNGHLVKVVLKEAVDEHKRFDAHIAGVEDHQIRFKTQAAEIITTVANIHHCKLIPIL